MTHQELELWVQDIIEDVLSNRHVEDSKVELKSFWPDAEKAAPILAAHANAARGESILWLIGLDEKGQRITNLSKIELADWYKSLQRWFDGDAPRMLLTANVKRGTDTVVALYFETHQGSPFVVTNPKGGFPEFIVPWREGTGKRAAGRLDLLRILVPIRRLSALVDELHFNFEVTEATKTIDSLGALFREDEFHRILKDGVLSTLPSSIRKSIIDAYVFMQRANHLVSTTLSVPSQHRQPDQLDQAWKAVRNCRDLIDKAQAGLARR